MVLQEYILTDKPTAPGEGVKQTTCSYVSHSLSEVEANMDELGEAVPQGAASVNRHAPVTFLFSGSSEVKGKEGGTFILVSHLDLIRETLTV